MSSSLLRKTVAVTSLLFFLLAGYGSAFGAVWCLCADAQPAQEQGDGVCGAKPEPLSQAGCCGPPAPASLSAGASCGSCIDIYLAQPGVKSRSRTLRGLAPAPVVPPAALPRVASLFSDGLALPQASRLFPNPAVALAHLRTVVLLN